jgi:hypothetical protein
MFNYMFLSYNIPKLQHSLRLQNFLFHFYSELNISMFFQNATTAIFSCDIISLLPIVHVHHMLWLKLIYYELWLS